MASAMPPCVTLLLCESARVVCKTGRKDPCLADPGRLALKVLLPWSQRMTPPAHPPATSARRSGWNQPQTAHRRQPPIHTMERNRFAKHVVSAISTSLLLLGGCTREDPPVFVASQERQQLPESHQRQIEEALNTHFGTPVNPRLTLPAEDDESPVVQVFDSDQLKYGAAVFNRRCAVWSRCHWRRQW